MGGSPSRCLDCVPFQSAQSARSPGSMVRTKSPEWSKAAADKLQEAVDQIFGTREGAGSLHNLEFSFSIADPLLDGCPLIGCSTGFTKLCGYGLNDIVGRNCRFLVDPVPADQVDKNMRRHTKDFCEAVRDGRGYSVPMDEREEWMTGTADRPNDELFAMQKNARKDGSLFNNLFYMKVFNLGTELGGARPYIVALQSELLGGKEDLQKLAENVELLDGHMLKLKKKLASLFFMQSSMNRQLHTTFTRATDEDQERQAPKHLYAVFDPEQVQPWSADRFKFVRKLADAARNEGVVKLIQDEQSGQRLAVKQMPNSWMKGSQEEFIRAHPDETEWPWQDIGCTQYLNSVGFKYACNLQGVYRSNEHTYVASSFESQGDLFCTTERGSDPGEHREEELMELVLEIFRSVQQLHDMEIAHRDISVENILQSCGENGAATVRLIDFGMSSTGQLFQNSVRGKPSYQAPEMHTKSQYNAFLSDSFATGVIIFIVLLRDYPWLSTKPGGCKCFEYVRQNSLRSFCKVRKARGSTKKLSECMSAPLMELLEGMLTFNPDKRLTMGEKQWPNRRSVWDEPWTKHALQTVGGTQEQGASRQNAGLIDGNETR